MASQEPECQIVPLLGEFEESIPLSPPVKDLKGVQEPSSEHSEHHGGDGEPYQQDSYGSCVEETQFESIEIDSQAVEDPNFPAIHPNSQLREANVSMAPLDATGHIIPHFSRPVDDAADPTDGFIFGKAVMPPTFNRPAVPVKPQSLAKQASEEDQQNGATKSISPEITVGVQPDPPSRAMPLREPSFLDDKMVQCIRIGGEFERKRAEEPPQQEALSITVATHDPRTPVLEASNGRLAQKSSNKSHKRIKKPFPEIAGPPGSRRWRSNMSTTNTLRTESPLSYAKHSFEAASPGNFANTGQTRTFSPIMDNNNSSRRRHHPSSVLDSSHSDGGGMSGGYADSIAQQQSRFPVQSSRRSSAPLHHSDLAWDMNEQDVLPIAIHAPHSVYREPYSAQMIHQDSEPLCVTDVTRIHPDNPGEITANTDVMVQQNLHNNNLQEEVSKGAFNETEQDAQDPTHFPGSQAAVLSGSIGNRYSFSMRSRVPSRAPSEAPSRPHSRRSNCGKPITRPITAQDLRPQGVLESIAQRPTHSMEVMKSSDAPNNPIASEASAQPTVFVRERTQGFFDDYKKFLATGQEYLEVLQDYERQSQLLESQKVQIQKLRGTSESSVKQIQALESDKVDLTEKLKKFTELSSKYKKHMNDVVKAQKYLKLQASEIKQTAKEAIEARDAREADLQKLERAIEDARNLQPAEKFAEVSKKNQRLETENKKLVSENENFVVSIEKLRSENENLTVDNNKLQIDLGAATKTCELLRADINKTLMELSREKYHMEQLEKARDELPDSHKELVELLKKTPKEVADELNRDEGLLGKILDVGKATQAKVDEVTIISNNYKNQEVESSASLIKLFEDLFSKFEASMQASKNDGKARQESNNKHLEDLKQTVNQLRLDKEAEIQLNNRISELVQINEALAVDKNAREREVQGLTTQLDELKRELAKCRGQLSAKNDELAAALAAPKEDPRLRAQIQDLETANNTVTSQLEESKQELARLKEGLGTFQESARRKEQQIKDWEHKFDDAQSRIKNLTEEKNKILSNKQQEMENACQEARQTIAKSAEASKATQKMKLESEINHLEQKVKEKDAELALAKDDLHKAQDRSEAHKNNANKFQEELALYKEQLIQQTAQLKRLEERNTSQETSDRLSDSLQSIRSECAELQKQLESIRRENTQNVEAATRGQQAIQGNLRRIDALENETEKLKETNAELQKRFERLNEVYNQRKAFHNRYGDDRRPIGGAKNTTFTTPVGVLPTQQTRYPRPLPAILSSVDSNSVHTNDRILDDHGAETPESALHRAAKGIGSHKSGPQFGKATETSLSMVTNNPETPQISSRKTLTGISLNSPHTNSSSASQHQQQGSGTRPLKIAARKRSTFGQSSQRKSGPHHLSHTETITEGVQAAYTSKGTSHSTDVAAVQTPSGISPFSQAAVTGPSPSPYTDLSPMLDELGPVTNREQFQEAYEKVGSNKSEAPITNANVAGSGGLQAYAQDTMASLEESEATEANAVPKAHAPSAEEEASRRRTVQPLKSAIKKPLVANNSAASAPKLVDATITQAKTSAHPGNKALSQIQDGHRGSYNRAVSGSKPQTPKTGILPVAKESSLGAWTGKQQSPPMSLPKRNNSKRLASSAAQPQQAPKRARIRGQRGVSFKNVEVVPDSQENIQNA